MEESDNNKKKKRRGGRLLLFWVLFLILYYLINTRMTVRNVTDAVGKANEVYMKELEKGKGK